MWLLTYVWQSEGSLQQDECCGIQAQRLTCPTMDSKMPCDWHSYTQKKHKNPSQRPYP